MFKKSLLLISGLIAGSFIANFSVAADAPLKKEAGTVLQKSEKPVYKATIDPKLNMTSVLPAPAETKSTEDKEIHFSADEVENNQEMQIVTASGNVNIMQDNLTLIADKVIYNQKEDIVTATGNVILVEKDGSVSLFRLRGTDRPNDSRGP